MAYFTRVAGRLANGEPIQVFLAEEDGRITQTGMHSAEHPLTEDEFVRRLGGRGWQPWPVGTGAGLLDAAAAQVEDYCKGRQLEFDLPLAPRGTAFQLRVWEELRRIPYGQTRSYGDIAKSIGKPQAMRAVGGANGRNPLSLITPCHRVIAADGKIGGFTGGVGLKKHLLAHEALVLARRNAA